MAGRLGQVGEDRMSPTLAPGGGIEAKLAEYGDSPATDELFDAIGSYAYGWSGRLYRYLKATNQTHVYEPLNLNTSAPTTSAPAAPTAPGEPFNVDSIVWIGSPNYEAGRAGYAPKALILHTMAGSLAGSDSWFNNPSSEVSAHFGIGLDGTVHQYVSSQNTSWANGVVESGNRWQGIFRDGANPNYRSLAIETEDLGSITKAVTGAQYAAVEGICRLMLGKYPSITYLMGHSSISPASRSNCPGPRWVASGKFAKLAASLGLKAVL